MDQKFFADPAPGGLNEDDFNAAVEAETSRTKFNERMPKMGETVIFFPNPDDTVARSNGHTSCAAIVTQAWSSVCVNLKIIPDHGPMQDRGSVSHHSANPAGYHFKFMNEVYPDPVDFSKVVFK